MGRKVAESKSVAYFDHPDHVSEPGFYIVEKESADSESGDVEIGRRVYPSSDGEGFEYEEDDGEGADE